MSNPAEESKGKVFAFLDLATFDDGAVIRGGCLVTDGDTHPLEFRVSGAIQPTSMQRILFGDALREYICIDLVGLPMLEALEGKPDLILVRDPEFLKLRPKIETPVLWARSTENSQYMLQAYPGYDQEAEAGRDVLPKRLRGHNIMEPFMRIRAALEEAHKLKVAEQQVT
jgi:hypothetical protein